MNTVTVPATAPVPTGNVWLPTPEDPATIPVPLPVIIVAVEGPYTEQDRKLWTFLLHAVWDDLETQPVHELPVRDINLMFRQLSGRHHSDWIWESAKRLAKTTVEWRVTQGDKRYKKGISALFGAETEEEDRERGVLRFNFPPLLIPILKDPRRFARLRTHFMIELSGKYAVTLYELLESAANKEMPVLKVGVEELRQWLKVPEGKLHRWQDFRRRVLEPAIQQINERPDGAGFSVKMQPMKEGRSISRVHFEVVKTKEREAIDLKLRDKDRQLDLFAVRLKTSTYERAKQVASGWDIYAMEAEWREWGMQQKDWPPQNPDGAFINFCKKRGPYPGTA
jgi:hypothetical protein